MLDQETKRRIDSLRDILVGKVPDPKSQVEQITLSLIYKFMNDMDDDSMSMGGVASFFVDDYEKYSWKNLFNTKLGGADLVNLYSEGITKMNQNPHLPQIFRDVFKNAYIPYRDPETLRLFLKTINDFQYTHSEKLGDAYEYLLSILGSQGNAGQFRTPRHIIDFIVEIVNPKKDETILDPACGTAGFLISSYNYILKNNTSKNIGDKLKPEERKQLTQNVNGYDIEPEMVRMSIVNMYLHNFTDPKIYEYDTLTSEDRWDEYYDVILANPPFMTPKGGIKPHRRFGVQANKSEVLFVSYILEHLTPKGRAGIIIPEGIIQTKNKTYIELRKQLINKGIIGVISLPPGVFQPYSPVKTSILILDKELSQKFNNIFFARINNDGFDLGAQRKKIEKNDLPIILEEVCKFISKGEKKLGTIKFVNKEKILSNNICSLNEDAYFKIKEIVSDFNLVNINEVVEFKNGSTIKKNDLTPGNVPVIAGGKKPAYFHGNFNRDKNYITISSSGANAGFVNFHDYKIFASDCFTIKSKSEKLLQKFLFYLIKSQQEQIYSFQTGAAQPHVYSKDFKEFYIPLPPLKVQQVIVDELEGYKKIINGSKQVVENYRPTINIDTSWKIVELRQICDVISGQSPESKFYNEKKAGLPFYQGKSNFGDTFLEKTETYTSKVTKISKKGDIVMSVRAPVGPVNLTPFDICIGRGLCAIRPNDKIELEYLFNLFISKNIVKGHMGTTYESINRDEILKIMIPLPPSKIQKEIVQKIKVEKTIIDGNKKLIELYAQKIQDLINKVWGDAKN